MIIAHFLSNFNTFSLLHKKMTYFVDYTHKVEKILLKNHN